MKKITVENLDNTKEEVELVNAFDVKDINRSFVILSKGESLGEGMSKVYISEVILDNGVYKLVGITDESVWDKVKPAMKDIVQGDETKCSVNLEGSRNILDSFRVIGIKDSDKEKLVQASLKQESSFVPNENVSEPMIQNQPIVEVVPEIMPEVTVLDSTPEVNQVSEPAPVFMTPEPVVETPVMTEVPVETSVFDIPLQEVAPEQPVMESPSVNLEPTMPVINEEVQGGVQNTTSTELSTPQDFFNNVEQPSNDIVITQEIVDSNKSDDPAVLMLNSLKELIDSKNEMISALNEKNSVLTKQVEDLKEAIKVSEAQRIAAETTLTQAKSADVNGGPALVYQQPVYQNQNFNQTA